MKFVEATFYFKDGTVLEVLSESGIYNNKTLDMNFDVNVRANMREANFLHKKLNILIPKVF